MGPAIVEIEQGEAVVDERRGSLLDASVGIARVEGEQLAGAEAVARAIAFHNAMPLAHEAYDGIVVGVRREQLVEAGEMPELDRAAKGAAVRSRGAGGGGAAEYVGRESSP